MSETIIRAFICALVSGTVTFLILQLRQYREKLKSARKQYEALASAYSEKNDAYLKLLRRYEEERESNDE